MNDVLLKYFPESEKKQIEQLEEFASLLSRYNEVVNLISRADAGNIFERHILHSLSIARLFNFSEGSRIMDLGTGGGFPGIPLAVCFPSCEFVLIDSIGKKIKAVGEMASALNLRNITTIHGRAENAPGSFDVVVSRAVAPVNMLLNWVSQKVRWDRPSDFVHGMICLKGGNLDAELSAVKKMWRVYELRDVFEEEYFSTKKLVHIY